MQLGDGVQDASKGVSDFSFSLITRFNAILSIPPEMTES